MLDSTSNNQTEIPRDTILIDPYIKNYLKTNLTKVFTCYSQILEAQKNIDPKAKFGRKPSHLFRNLFGNTKPNSENSILLYCIEFIFNNFTNPIEDLHTLKQLLQEQTDFNQTPTANLATESVIEIITPEGIVVIGETRNNINKTIPTELPLKPSTTPSDHEISAWLIDQFNRN